jgi:acylglycerol lipase
MAPQQYSWKHMTGEKVHAVEWKPKGKAKAVVVLVHGIGEHSGRYQHVAEFFNRSNIAVLSFDLLGHGRSEGKCGDPKSFPAICTDLQHSILDAKKKYPNTPVFLYGHSLGGELVVFHTIMNRPEIAGIIGTGVAFRQTFPVPGWKMLIGKIADKIMPAFTMPSSIDVTALSRDPKVVEAYKNDPLVHPMISAGTAMDIICQGEWLIANANKLEYPILLMSGSEDRMCSVEGVKEFAANAPKGLVTLKIWKGLFHEIHNEPEKAQVLKFMVDWILKHLK